MESVQRNIERIISRYKKGAVLFPSDFRGIGTESAIKMALSRLTKEGKLGRLGHGIYFIPKTDPLFDAIYPGPEEVAESLARKEKVRIRPAGAYALHRLGLTTQVPTRLVYITDGSPRTIKIGKATIRFIKASPKKLAVKGEISGLVLQALDELDIDNIDVETENKIRELLKKEVPSLLKNDLTLAPARIHDYIVRLLKVAT